MSTASRVATAREILRAKAIRTFDEPIELASGKLSRHFIDGKAGLCEAADLQVACGAIHALVSDAGIAYDACGGLTLGADHLAVGVAIAGDRRWFFVRKEPKGRGTGKQIEGAEVGPGVRVLLVEDVVSTGGSMLKAFDIIAATGAEIVAAATLIDRGDTASAAFAKRGVPYFTLGTYRDFGLDPV
mgnify:CR=1 FL=1